MHKAPLTKAQKLENFQKQFSKSLPEKLTTIVSGWESLQKEYSSFEAGELLRHVHSLAGSGSTFGFLTLGDKALELENLLQPLKNDMVSEEAAHKITSFMQHLQEVALQGPDKNFSKTNNQKPQDTVNENIVDQTVEQKIESTSEQNSPYQPTSKNKDIKPLIYMLEDDEELAAETALQLKHFGYTAKIFHNTTDIAEALSHTKPDALLVDIHLSEGANAGPEMVEEFLSTTKADLPVVFISGNDTWQNRLNSVRAGGQVFMSKPLNMDDLIVKLDSILNKNTVTQYRILIVDDTQLLAEHYADVLESAGMQTKIVCDPSELLNSLQQFAPDLVLMDIFMPNCTGIEAASVIRQDTQYLNLPIVYLSAEKDIQQQLNALQVGGDEFLVKPISDIHLQTAVKIRAERFHQLNALMVRDSLTGLLNHINLKIALDQEISRTKRRGNTLSFVMLDIDYFKNVNDQYGHPEGDRVIKTLARILTNRLRKTDTVARYGGEEFAIIMPDTPLENTQKVLEEILFSFSQIVFSHPKGNFTVTFSAGAAAYSPDNDMESLIALADRALYQAKNQGRNQVVGVDIK